MGFAFARASIRIRYAALKGRPLNGNRIGMLIGRWHAGAVPGGRIAATAKGAPVLNALVAELAADQIPGFASTRGRADGYRGIVADLIDARDRSLCRPAGKRKVPSMPAKPEPFVKGRLREALRGP